MYPLNPCPMGRYYPRAGTVLHLPVAHVWVLAGVPGSVHRRVRRRQWRSGARLCGYNGMKSVIALAGLALRLWLDQDTREAQRM